MPVSRSLDLPCVGQQVEGVVAVDACAASGFALCEIGLRKPTVVGDAVPPEDTCEQVVHRVGVLLEAAVRP